MNLPLTSDFAAGLVTELRAFLALCETVLASVSSENQALAGHSEYQPISFYQQRKNLLPDLETALSNLRSTRLVWPLGTATMGSPTRTRPPASVP